MKQLEQLEQNHCTFYTDDGDGELVGRRLFERMQTTYMIDEQIKLKIEDKVLPFYLKY